jgi:hypothetical protein
VIEKGEKYLMDILMKEKENVEVGAGQGVFFNEKLKDVIVCVCDSTLP